MVDVETMIEAVPFWGFLSDSEKKEIAYLSTVQSFAAGSRIHDGDQSCLGVFFVVHGLARAYMLSEEGREITLFRVEENESCVLSASCVLPMITFDIFVEAREDTQLVVVPSDCFSRLMEVNSAIEAYAYKQAAQRFSEVMWVMQQHLFMSSSKRLALFLLDEVSRTGDSYIGLTHEEIARNIGSAREVVTRTLKSFANEELVELSRGGLRVLNARQLSDL